MEWAKEKKITKPNNYNKKKPIRTEVLPDWFDKDENKAVSEKSEPAKTTEDIEQNKREIEEMLKKLRS